MAWQTPKVNWSAEDGVMDSDFNRIEGNIQFLKETSDSVNSNVLTGDLVLYVSPSGSDGGDGTTGSPYRSITKALSMVPKNLSGRSVIISLAAGTYAESVVIEGFDAPITLTGTVGTAVTFSSLRVNGCVCLVGSISITTNGSVFVTNGGKLTGDFDLTVRGYTITVNYGGVLTMNNLVATNVSGYVVEVNRGGIFYASSISGTGNTSGIRSQSGAAASFGSNSMNVSGVQYTTATGGRIYTGSQTPSTGL